MQSHTQQPSLCHPTLVFLRIPSQSQGGFQPLGETVPLLLEGRGQGLVSRCLISLPPLSPLVFHGRPCLRGPGSGKLFSPSLGLLQDHSVPG